jgi:large subunit ribosomal protein L21
MYAIIRSGGKQAKVRPGDVIDVELLKTDDENVSFTPLLVVDESGTAITDRSQLGDLTVTAKVLGEVKGPKIDIFKYKNKTGYRRRQGHRQRYTRIQVTGISTGAKKATKKKAAPKKAAEAEPEAAAEEASDSAATAAEEA